MPLSAIDLPKGKIFSPLEYWRKDGLIIPPQTFANAK